RGEGLVATERVEGSGLIGAEGGTRTPTGNYPQRFLRPPRLPFRHFGRELDSILAHPPARDCRALLSQWLATTVRPRLPRLAIAMARNDGGCPRLPRLAIAMARNDSPDRPLLSADAGRGGLSRALAVPGRAVLLGRAFGEGDAPGGGGFDPVF